MAVPTTITRRWFGAAAVLSAAVVLAGCVSYQHLYGPDGNLDEAQAQRVGKRLYENRCTLCHAMYQPSSYEMETWDSQIRRFGAKAGLTKEERRFVRLYLDSHAPDGERRARLLRSGDSR
jgi:hypothetical protein